jgi:hypothetical protein
MMGRSTDGKQAFFKKHEKARISHPDVNIWILSQLLQIQTYQKLVHLSSDYWQ